MPFFAVLETLNYYFLGQFQPSQSAKSKFRASECGKIAIFKAPDSPTLISRKI